MASVHEQMDTVTTPKSKCRRHVKNNEEFEDSPSKKLKVSTSSMERRKCRKTLMEPEPSQDSGIATQNDCNSSVYEEKSTKNESNFESAISDDENSFLRNYSRPLSQPSSPCNETTIKFDVNCCENFGSDSSLSQETPESGTKIDGATAKQRNDYMNRYNNSRRKKFKSKIAMQNKIEEKQSTKEEKSPSWMKPLSGWSSDNGHSEELVYNRQSGMHDSNIISSPSTSSSQLSLSQSNSPSYVYLSPRETDQREKNFLRRQSNKFNSNDYYNLDDVCNLNSGVTFIDTHCHLDFLFKQCGFRKNSHKAFQELHKDSYPSCYEGCVAIFCDPRTFKENMWKEILSEDGVWGAFGCHPHKADLYNDEIENHMLQALKHPKIVALGEIGLDYSNRNNADHSKQKEVFRKQLRIAVDRELPLVIHSRDATRDTLDIMKEIVPRTHTIHRHCFTRDWAEAQIWLKDFPNLYLGLTNLVTFSGVSDVHEVARNIPLERLLLETDAPYFVPRSEGKDTKRSHPGMAIHVAAQIAHLRQEPLEKILICTRQNTQCVYGI